MKTELTKKSGLPRCQKLVSDGGHSVTFHQCYNKGIVTFEGKTYCSCHDPAKLKTNQEAKYQDFLAKIQKEKTRNEFMKNLPANLETISNEMCDTRLREELRDIINKLRIL